VLWSLFLFSVLLGSIATVLFLVWQNERRNQRGIMLATKSMMALNTIYAVFSIIYSLPPKVLHYVVSPYSHVPPSALLFV